MRSADDPATRFQRLAWPHRHAVLRTARMLVRNAADADDLAQETMLKAFAAIDRFADGTNARAWLTSILRNAWIDRVRAAASRPGSVSLDRLADDPADDPEDLPAEPADGWTDPAEVERLMERFSDAQVIDGLLSLPAEIRWTLLLVDVEGLGHADAAGILGVPVGTIKSRAHRGRTMLRTALAARAKDLRMIG